MGEFRLNRFHFNNYSAYFSECIDSVEIKGSSCYFNTVPVFFYFK